MTSDQPAISTTLFLELFSRMALIRAFFARSAALHDRQEIRGSIHLGVGQEAIAVGVCSALDPDDAMTVTYRGHASTIAKGTPVREVLAEMCGRSTGCCGGLGGSLHLADARVSNLGANAIVGGGVPIAVGAALARQLDGTDRVAAAFFGDGAINQGVVMEALNLAALWKLPVLFVCENNQYAEMTPRSQVVATATIAERARAFGMTAYTADGMDVAGVRRIATLAVRDLRAGRGPIFIEFETYRFSGHYHGDPETIRPSGERDAWEGRDPLALARQRLLADGVNEDEIAMAEMEAEHLLDQAETFALSSPRPRITDAVRLVASARTSA